MPDGSAYMISNGIREVDESDKDTGDVDHSYIDMSEGLNRKNAEKDFDTLIANEPHETKNKSTDEINHPETGHATVDDKVNEREYLIDDGLDIEEKIKLSTIGEFDDLKEDPFVKAEAEQVKEAKKSALSTDILERKRGRPKKAIKGKVRDGKDVKDEIDLKDEKGSKDENEKDEKESGDEKESKDKNDGKVKDKVGKVKNLKRGKQLKTRGKKGVKKKKVKEEPETIVEESDNDEKADEETGNEEEKPDKKKLDEVMAETNLINKNMKQESHSMSDFKKMLKVWDENIKNEPEKSFTDVHYGHYLKPVSLPPDLDSNFFSADCNGYYCSNCFLLFKNKIKFIRHRFQTDGKCYYECDICNKRFMVRSEMAGHRKYHTKDRPFACHLCDGRYSRRHTLNLHIQQNHQHQNPYMCYICGKLFKIRPCLIRHLKYGHIQESEKMALCSQCPKRFKSEHDLKAHARTHLTEKLWPCDICNKPFKTKKYMKEHRKIHSQERVQICETCGKGFFKLEHLKNHSLLHSGKKPFACTICTYRCTVKCNLQKHMKVHDKRFPHPQ